MWTSGARPDEGRVAEAPHPRFADPLPDTRGEGARIADPSPQTFEQRFVDLDPVPQVPQAEVLVRGVLVVVVVGDRQPDDRRAVRLLEEVHRNAPADRRQADRAVSRRRHQRSDPAREPPVYPPPPPPLPPPPTPLPPR